MPACHRLRHTNTHKHTHIHAAFMACNSHLAYGMHIHTCGMWHVHICYYCLFSFFVCPLFSFTILSWPFLYLCCILLMWHSVCLLVLGPHRSSPSFLAAKLRHNFCSCVSICLHFNLQCLSVHKRCRSTSINVQLIMAMRNKYIHSMWVHAFVACSYAPKTYNHICHKNTLCVLAYLHLPNSCCCLPCHNRQCLNC